jgi:hypothetical protein
MQCHGTGKTHSTLATLLQTPSCLVLSVVLAPTAPCTRQGPIKAALIVESLPFLVRKRILDSADLPSEINSVKCTLFVNKFTF